MLISAEKIVPSSMKEGETYTVYEDTFATDRIKLAEEMEEHLQKLNAEYQRDRTLAQVKRDLRCNELTYPMKPTPLAIDRVEVEYQLALRKMEANFECERKKVTVQLSHRFKRLGKRHCSS